PDDDADAGAGRFGCELDGAGGDRDEDDEHEDHAEHLPSVAAHELSAATERLQPGGPLEHDHGRGHRPHREQDQTRHDDQDEAHDHSQPDDEGHYEQLAEHRHHRL